MKMSNTQLTSQVLERDQRRSSLLAEALDEGELSPGGEEERRGEGSGDSPYLGSGLRASYLAWCCARALGPPRQRPGTLWSARGPPLHIPPLWAG